MKTLGEIFSDRRVKVIEFGDDGAAFIFRPSREARTLRVILSFGGGWDHVSVSTSGKTPTWAEMEAVKRLCFASDEVAMQLHVAEADHISIRHNCLHLWRPHAAAIPLPPKVFV